MEASYKFGPYKIDSREVFHATPLSYAMVNLRPLLPGIIPYPSTPVCCCNSITRRNRKRGKKKFSSFGKCGPTKVTWIKQRLPNVE
jgi:hypothetical protein